MSLKIKLPAEEFLTPINRFNEVVGPLFNDFRDRGKFPLKDEHTDAGLARSLGVFLESCFVKAVAGLEKINPVPMTNDEWSVASEEAKRPHLHWQANLRYLKQRRRYYADLMGYRGHGKVRADEDEESWLEA